MKKKELGTNVCVYLPSNQYDKNDNSLYILTPQNTNKAVLLPPSFTLLLPLPSPSQFPLLAPLSL